ncbi:MAG TPA: GC-type dockerin domain-anchored protein [Phycisphaerales bacterium]|nr:GC-type dockerin domain-anchored protein [Phycisphaerales bacterium]
MHTRSYRRPIPSLLVAALAGCAPAALAQSFNIDLNLAAGQGAGVPASSFSAAAGQAGTWNNISQASNSTVGLFGLNGALTSVTLTWPKASGITGIADADTTSQAAKAFLDGQFLASSGSLAYTVSNLAAGTYAVFTYAARPGASMLATVSVAGSTSSTQNVGPDLSSQLVPGETHAIHIVTVGAGGSIQLNVADSDFGNASCSAIQIRKIDSQKLRFYVNPIATLDSAGTSWESGLRDLQPVLQHAALVGGSRCEIWVRGGIYRPTSGTDRNASFVIPSGLWLLGGFGGHEDDADDRIFPNPFESRLDGDIGTISMNDNSYHVVRAPGATITTRFDGFTIASGNASGSGDNSDGGGLFAPGSTLRVANCTFINCRATGDGGGAFISSSVQFDDTTFYKCIAQGQGGGVYHHTTGTSRYRQVRFLGCQALAGGAAKILFAEADFLNCLFTGNASTFDSGGALSIAGDADDESTLTNCTLTLNTALAAHGGLYANNSAKVLVSNCILWGNNDLDSDTPQERQRGVNASAVITEQYTMTENNTNNPRFVDADGPDNLAGTFDDDCRLQIVSLCIDAGEDDVLPLDSGDADHDGITNEPYPIDLDGLERVYDTPWMSGFYGLVDRGCYEYREPSCPSDFDNSGFVDLDDYVAFVSAFEQGEESADFDQTGFVDTDDFTAFVLAFESGC